ncbi:uncharacterized protein B0J16DRAFT_412397 [Fusarium flagelliforme]|uniref:uncharacterized protein n=1 Tax=Fusarium flagelliforme TaxID=2675880 RepID=UPI001E8E5308|nr:uncharacterized protein B0J16DRAFT_412397 [Fusarium flagelliforme]KAH7193832.1 hypothetical protein B0J16DRAFT_412397 [Fusarium flagelliforme]
MTAKHQNCSDFCVLAWNKDNDEWNGPTNPRSAELTIRPDSHVTVIYADADKVRDCPSCRKYFTDEFLMPELWWAGYSRRSNGYFGSETFRDDNGEIASLNTWSRFMAKQLHDNSHEWYKFNIFTRWIASSQKTILIIFEVPGKHRLRKVFPTSMHNETLSDPFWFYLHLLEEFSTLQDNSVWAIRDRVRDIEKQKSREKPNPRYRFMHDTARHAIHVSETLEVAEKTVASIIAQHKSFQDEMSMERKVRAGYRRVGERLLWYDHILSSLRHRASANKERLLNEVQLAFHSVAQYDSRIAVKIGKATQTDSAAMKTIAFVTLTFLPATFISALFSMSFFNVSDDTGEWTVNKEIWMYFVIAIPVTLITCGVWWLWQKSFQPVWIGEEEEPNTLRDLRRKIKRGDSQFDSYEMA